VLEIPRYFRAVAEAYEKWYDVTDEEILDLLRESIRKKKLKSHNLDVLEA
jgi:predicted phosphoribosyltransferase